MYFLHSQAQRNVCLICGENTLKKISLIHLIYDYPICIECLNKFKKIHYQSTLKGVIPLNILYAYDDFFKELLFQYKGRYDYALKNVFLAPYMGIVKKRYQDYIVAVAPSSHQSNKIRGFAPAAGIATSFSSSIFTGLYKTEEYKQSDQKYEERALVRQAIDIHHGNFLHQKKVLLFDDVITSGCTIERCAELIKTYHPSCLEVLILATRSYALHHPLDKAQKSLF